MLKNTIDPGTQRRINKVFKGLLTWQASIKYQLWANVRWAKFRYACKVHYLYKCVSVGFWQSLATSLSKAYRNTHTWIGSISYIGLQFWHDTYICIMYISSTRWLNRIYCNVLKNSWTVPLGLSKALSVNGQFFPLWRRPSAPRHTAAFMYT